MTTYRIVRMFLNAPKRAVNGYNRLSLEQAQAYCKDPATSSSTCTPGRARRISNGRGPWFDGYEEE